MMDGWMDRLDHTSNTLFKKSIMTYVIFFIIEIRNKKKKRKEKKRKGKRSRESKEVKL